MKYVTIDANNVVTNILVFENAADAAGIPDIFPLGVTQDIAKIGDIYIPADGEVENFTTAPATADPNLFSGFDFNGVNYSATDEDMSRLLELYTFIVVEPIFTESIMLFSNDETLAVTDLNVVPLMTAMGTYRRTIIGV